MDQGIARYDLDRVDRLLSEAGLDALVLLDESSVDYATGQSNWIFGSMREYMLWPGGGPQLYSPTMAILPIDGLPISISPAWCAVDDLSQSGVESYFYGALTLSDLFQSAPLRSDPWFSRLQHAVKADQCHPTAFHALKQAVIDRGFDADRIGVEASAASTSVVEQVAAAAGLSTVRDCSYLMRLIRAVKSSREIELLQAVASINEQAGVSALTALAHGAPLRECLRVFTKEVTANGALFEHFMTSDYGLAFGTKGGSGRPIANEAVAIDWGCILSGYGSDTGHTVLVGDVDHAVIEQHHLLADCIELGASMLKPGALSSDIRDTMSTYLAEHGVTASNPHGHGLGREVRDLPIIAAPALDGCGFGRPFEVNRRLERNMVVNLEATIMLPPHGAVEVERTFVVQEDGSRPLIPQDRADPIGLK